MQEEEEEEKEEEEVDIRSFSDCAVFRAARRRLAVAQYSLCKPCGQTGTKSTMKSGMNKREGSTRDVNMPEVAQLSVGVIERRGNDNRDTVKDVRTRDNIGQ